SSVASGFPSTTRARTAGNIRWAGLGGVRRPSPGSRNGRPERIAFASRGLGWPRMERWCPRCEWLGQADGACPRCRTPLVDLSATSMAPLDTAVPPWARPRIVRHARVAALDHASQPERTWIEEGTGLPDVSKGRLFPAHRWVWIPIGLVLAVM